jgi:hypothetical protein
MRAAVAARPVDFPGCLTLFSWDLTALDLGHQPQIGVGAVLLTVETCKDGFLQLGVTDDAAPYRRARLVSHLELSFSAARYTAFSVDPELGFETQDAYTARGRPWTLDLGTSEPCLLNIVEKASQYSSRLLQMTLRLPHEGERKTDVLLIDPAPLTVVRVNASEKQHGKEILAEYIDDADQAPEWRFASVQGKMHAVLPPQGIGEEMVKGNLHLLRDGQRLRVPQDDELFDFRLTPVARLVLDRTDVDMARSEAPWSLRRLLARRLGAVGLGLDRADFELLYGLSARLQAPGLRIAELDGFVGRVPLPQDLRRAREEDRESVERSHGRNAALWIEGLWRRPSWWRVYADIAQRGRLVLDRGIEYRLRPTRQTADPFEIGSYAVPSSADASREPLRGGVDWPFQSRNIYNELQPTAPTVSSAGSIEGLAFGSLGGEGAQTAAFNNGKTLIITSSRQGRIDSLTLIRVGRIAMLWNKARHVIVYERTTRRSPRYDPYPGHDLAADDLELQPDFPGIAALRKVREYVEITEPRRSYPDARSERPTAGPLTRSVFNSTTIPVRSDWGRDIRDGFVIALRGPVPPWRDDFFPDPQVFLDFARAADKGEGHIGQRIRNTAQLVFFTSTRAQDGGDTDLWPSWPEVDFPLVRPMTPPPVPFSSSFQGRKRQPDAAPIELGMGPYTFTLEPAEEAANLLHQRPVKGLESKISNINLARGLPAAEPVLNAAQRTVVQVTANLAATQSVLLDGLQELRAELAERVRGGQAFPLSQQPQLQADVRKLLDNLLTAAGTVGPTPGTTVPPGRSWADQQQQRLADYTAGVGREVQRLQEQLAQQAARLGSDLAQARGEASAILDTVAKQAQQRLGEVGYVPQHAVFAVRSGLDAALRRLQGQLSHLLLVNLQLLEDLQRRLARDPDAAAVLDALWREAMTDLPAGLRLIPETLRKVLDGDLAAWFSRLPMSGGSTVFATTEGAAAARIEVTAGWLARWADTIPPFDLEEPDFTNLQEVLDRELSPALISEALAGLQKWIDEAVRQLAGWDNQLELALKDLRDWELGLAARIAGAGDLKQLQDALADASLGLDQKLKQAAEEVRKKITEHLGGLVFAIDQGTLDSLGNLQTTAKDALQQMRDQLGGDLAGLEQAVRTQADLLERHLQSAARQAEDWVSQQVGSAYTIAKENIDNGLETLRVLAEGPVTDAMRTTRERIGYYFHNSGAGVLLTRASAVFNELPGDVLNALSVQMPFDQLTDRLKASIGGMQVRDLFPRLAGIDMTYLLPDLDVPLEGDHQYEWLRLQHGFDKDRLRAWAKVRINKRFESDATLFDLGPVKLKLLQPLFAGDSDILIEKNGQRTQRTSALLKADFELSLNGRAMVTMREGAVSFDESGKLDFAVDAEKIELAQELKFITDAVKQLMPEVEGFTLTPLLPAGVSSSLCLPLPDIGTGAFTLTGVTLNTHLDLRMADGFEISTGLWLSKPDRPFGMAVLFLGGGGWFGIDATYRPPSRFVTRVSIGISAGAFIALNFGFARGSAGILFTASVDFFRDWQTGGGSTAVSLGILVWGEFSVLGIASASMRLVLRVTYDDAGGMVGTGQFSVSIRICWCYTLRVSRQARKEFAKGSGERRQGSAHTAAALGGAGLAVLAAPDVGAAPPLLVPPAGAPGYAQLLRAADPLRAVDDFLETLAIVSP